MDPLVTLRRRPRRPRLETGALSDMMAGDQADSSDERERWRPRGACGEGGGGRWLWHEGKRERI